MLSSFNRECLYLTGKPGAVKGCRVEYDKDEPSSAGVYLTCQKGYSEKSQHFIFRQLNGTESRRRELLNQTLDEPKFKISNPDLSYEFKIVAVNSIGSSPEVSFIYRPSSPSSMTTAESSNYFPWSSNTQVIAISLGVILTLGFSLMVVVCALKWTQHRIMRRKRDYFAASVDEVDCFIDRKSSKRSSLTDGKLEQKKYFL